MACETCTEARQRLAEAARLFGRWRPTEAAGEARKAAALIGEKVMTESERVRERLRRR
jgi:hypothetical protein